MLLEAALQLNLTSEQSKCFLLSKFIQFLHNNYVVMYICTALIT